MRRKLKKLMRGLVYKYVKPPEARTNFSQVGEDIILAWLFNEKKCFQISYLDIGANHPVDTNNTYRFYLNGSSGVLVEANPELIPMLKKERPKDVVLNVAVSPFGRSELSLYLFNSDDSGSQGKYSTGGANTTCKEEAEKRCKSGLYELKRTITVQTDSINNIIKKYFSPYPDLLSIDIEGVDLDVLMSLDYEAFPIPAICVETCEYSESHIRPKDTRIIEFLLSKGYFVYADTYVNTIFVHKKWFSQK